jgi:anaerobic magnesium-protoporphyrin IX monomethyl ester cyclase
VLENNFKHPITQTGGTKMRIALVNLDLGYPIDFWPSKKQSIGIGYLAAVLQQAGYEVEILEERFLGHENVMRILETERFDVVGFKFIGLELSRDYLKAKTLKEAFDNPVTKAMKVVRDVHPETLIVAGDYSATFWDEETLRLTPTDVIVRGEGELSMLRLIEARRKGMEYETVPGISWLNGDAVCRTPGKLVDLDTLPRPIRLKHEPVDWLMVNSSRGCYGRCTFCATFALYGEKSGNWWRGRKPLSVIEEINDEYEKGFRNFQFADDDFIGIDPYRAEKIAREIIRKGLDVKLRLDARLNEVKEPLFRLLKEAGLKRVYLGCETGSQRDLKLFRKGTTVEQNIQAVKLAKSLGIEVNTGIIMFHPLSTLETLMDNITFIEKVEDEPALVQLASEIFIYKGTPIYREMKARGLLNSPLTTYQIVDPAARWVHDEFFNCAEKVQTDLMRYADKKYRSGDIKRDVVYQRSEEYLHVFKDLLKEAKQRFY